MIPGLYLAMDKLQNMLSGPELLKQCEDNWQTDMGAIIFGEDAILRGKSVLSDFKGASWMEYFLYGITGERIQNYAALVEGVWRISTSYPDPRLWNNRVAALAGTTRSTGVLAIAAGVAVSEATIYGLGPVKGAVDFLYRAEKQIRQDKTISEITWQELKKYRNVCGYGRPLVAADERIQPLLEFSKSLGLGEGKYMTLAFEIEAYLKSTRLKYQLNIAGVVAALAADHGATPVEHYLMAAPSFIAGMTPCYLDAINHPEGTFFPLSINTINYTGLDVTRAWRKS